MKREILNQLRRTLFLHRLTPNVVSKLSILFLLGCFQVQAQISSPREPTYTKEPTRWYISEDSTTLYITIDIGAPDPGPFDIGVMEDYNTSDKRPPWNEHLSTIQTVEIEEGVTRIGNYAFYASPQLKSVTVPGSVTSIGERAFGSCPALTSVTFTGSTPPSSFGEDVFAGVPDNVCFYVPPGTTEAYRQACSFLEGKKAGAHVTGIAMALHSDNLIINGTTRLTAHVLPSDALDQTVTWSSGDEQAVTVSADGTVTALSEGVAVIRVTTNEGNKTDSCELYVRSNNAALKNFIINNLTVTPAENGSFHPVTVGSDVTDVKIIPQPLHPKASASVEGAGSLSAGNNTFPLNVGNNTFIITVTAEDGTAKTYPVTVKRQGNDVTLSALTVNNDTPAPDENDFSAYSFVVGNDVTEVTVKAAPNDPKAVISDSTVTRSLHVGDNIFTFAVTAEDTTVKQVYRVNVRRLSNDAALSSLTVNGVPVPDFSPGNPNCSLAVKHRVNAVTIVATPAYAAAAVTGNVENHPVSVGDTSFVIKVISEDKTDTTEYILTVTRSMGNSNATLKNIIVNGSPLPEFNTNTAAYRLAVGVRTDNMAVIPETSHPEASATVEGAGPLNVGDNAVKITVTSENMTVTREYILTVKRLSGDVSLKSITVNGAPLSGYTETVDHTVTSITLSAQAADTLASVEGNDTYSLDFGANVFSIFVTAEDITVTKEYLITVIRIKPSGTCGESVYWNISEEGVLTVRGKGEMTDFESPSTAPWFYYSSLVTGIVIKEGVTSVGTFAFQNNAGLRSVVIPASVTVIGDSAFLENPKLSAVTNLNPNPQDIGDKWIFSDIIFDNNCRLYVPAGSEAAYKNAEVWKRFVIVEGLPTGIADVDRQAVKVCTSGGVLHVDSPAAERISIYSVTGTLLYSTQKPAGETTVNINHRKGVLIVRGSSGWTGVHGTR